MLRESELDFVAQCCSAEQATVLASVQPLWGGYGEILRVQLTGGTRSSAVVKCVAPPPAPADATSHARKCRSYDVETTFYQRFASRCDRHCRVARHLGSRATEQRWLLVVEDLDAGGFSRRDHHPQGKDLEACLGWLAAFHACFMNVPSTGLWHEGSYWHLSTRMDELRALGDAALEARAHTVDALLGGATHRTILHGDAKPANFCFHAERHDVAAVDFQYVGAGPGIKDVAYLLHGRSAASQAWGLDCYFSQLRRAPIPGVDNQALESEWRALYPVAIEDFERFLAGWRR